MLKVGKLDSDMLQSMVIDSITFKRPEVKTRAGVGEDCAVIDYGQYECVVSTDPITAAASDVGRLSIHISCNDIASNGVEPLGITLAVMLPEGTTEEDVQTIMSQAGAAAEAVGVEIIGGHTEVTPAVSQPVIVSTAFGRALSGASQSAHDMKPGDYILMTKWAGLEGTGIIAGDFGGDLGGVLSAEELAHAKSLLDDVSVVREGVIAGRIGNLRHARRDRRRYFGGRVGDVPYRRAGLRVEEASIPVDPVTLKIADHYGIDHLRLISSGCMLIMAAPSKKDEILAAVAEAGVPVSCIGRVCPASEGLMLEKADGSGAFEIAPPAADELYKVVK